MTEIEYLKCQIKKVEDLIEKYCDHDDIYDNAHARAVKLLISSAENLINEHQDALYSIKKLNEKGPKPDWRLPVRHFYPPEKQGNSVTLRIKREVIMSISFNDIPGLQVGHAQDFEAATGCTVILVKEGAGCGVDQRGGAPGTRETDLLRPMHLVEKVHAVLLTGGSAFGLAAADGVVRWPSALAMTVGSPPSNTATTLLVVPRSMPTARDMFVLLLGRCDRV